MEMDVTWLQALMWTLHISYLNKKEDNSQVPITKQCQTSESSLDYWNNLPSPTALISLFLSTFIHVPWYLEMLVRHHHKYRRARKKKTKKQAKVGLHKYPIFSSGVVDWSIQPFTAASFGKKKLWPFLLSRVTFTRRKCSVSSCCN